VLLLPEPCALRLPDGRLESDDDAPAETIVGFADESIDEIVVSWTLWLLLLLLMLMLMLLLLLLLLLLLPWWLGWAA
jgi:hypothetical protein